MKWETATLWLIWGTVPPTTLFVIIYGFTTRWWRNGFLGYALMFSSVGLTALVATSLLLRVLGTDYEFRPYLLFWIFTFIFSGAWFKLIALLIEKRNGRLFDHDSTYGHVVRTRSGDGSKIGDPTE